ncbi:hypothetical protein [Paenibacillus medicaginis]|uniref:Uncharacterized protein n=1 Tax=Paenibacillus medicaginis TaxID=1470560 RepID=A0ABV5BUF2_9BACL
MSKLTEIQETLKEIPENVDNLIEFWSGIKDGEVKNDILAYLKWVKTLQAVVEDQAKEINQWSEFYDKSVAIIERNIKNIQSLIKEYSNLLRVIEEKNKALEWVKKQFEEEWTYEMGIGEVVDEIIQRLEGRSK